MRFSHRQIRRIVALTLPLALVATACGGKKDGGDDAESSGPVRGGSVTYAVEAETGDGWCLPGGPAGHLRDHGRPDDLRHPHRAERRRRVRARTSPSRSSPTTTTPSGPSPLRDGVTFHDGTALTAEVVKNNLDAYRAGGPRPTTCPTRQPAAVPLRPREHRQRRGDRRPRGHRHHQGPWVAFPAFLYSSGRLGIVAQAQLDDTESCDTNLSAPARSSSRPRLGRGPGVHRHQEPRLLAGRPRRRALPVPRRDQLRADHRVRAAASTPSSPATSTWLHVSAAQDINTIRGLIDDGAAKARSVGRVRRGRLRPDERLQAAVRRRPHPPGHGPGLRPRRLHRGHQRGPASPWPTVPSPPARSATSRTPASRPSRTSRRPSAPARRVRGRERPDPRPISYQATPGAATQQDACYVQQTLEAVGITVELETVQQDALIDNAISGEFDMQGFRNYPGGDPDELYDWFTAARR